MKYYNFTNICCTSLILLPFLSLFLVMYAPYIYINICLLFYSIIFLILLKTLIEILPSYLFILVLPFLYYFCDIVIIPFFEI